MKNKTDHSSRNSINYYPNKKFSSNRNSIMSNDNDIHNIKVKSFENGSDKDINSNESQDKSEYSNKSWTSDSEETESEMTDDVDKIGVKRLNGIPIDDIHEALKKEEVLTLEMGQHTILGNLLDDKLGVIISIFAVDNALIGMLRTNEIYRAVFGVKQNSEMLDGEQIKTQIMKSELHNEEYKKYLELGFKENDKNIPAFLLHDNLESISDNTSIVFARRLSYIQNVDNNIEAEIDT